MACPGVSLGPRVVRACRFVGTGAQLKRHLVQARAERQQLHTTVHQDEKNTTNMLVVSNPAHLRAAASSRLQRYHCQQVALWRAYWVLAAAYCALDDHRMAMGLHSC